MRETCDGSTTDTACERDKPTRMSSVTVVAVWLPSAVRSSKSARMMRSRSPIAPLAISEAAGPMPSARETTQPADTTPSAPNASPPPNSALRHVSQPAAPPAARARSAAAVATMVGSPAMTSATPAQNTHSGRPTCCTSSHTTTRMIALESANAMVARAGSAAVPVRVPACGAGGDASRMRSASANWPAGLNRSAGVFASARMIAAATCAGTAGRIDVIGRGSDARCWRMMLSAGPVNGGVPASIS
jgi:hypothetical protein